MEYDPKLRIKQQAREYYARHREEILGRLKRRREANREKVRAHARAYYAANREKLAAYQRDYAAKRKEAAKVRLDELLKGLGIERSGT